MYWACISYRIKFFQRVDSVLAIERSVDLDTDFQFECVSAMQRPGLHV